MQHTRLLLLSIFISLCTLPTIAGLATGEWKSHMSYVEGQRIAISENKVYVVASGSLFSYGLSDNAVETYTKVNGLSDIYINDITYSEEYETLVICYENGNIDLMNTEGITNVPDLKQKTVYGSKTINRVNVFEDRAYISTAFGILNLNIPRAEISETYKLTNGETNGINGVSVLDNTIYAATDHGLFNADVNNSNLQNFANWSLVTSLPNYNNAIVDIIYFNNNLIVAQETSSTTSIYTSTDINTWSTLTSNTNFISFGVDENTLTLANQSNFVTYNTSLIKQSTISTYNFSNITFNTQNTVRAAHVIPYNNVFYIADTYQGLISYSTSSLAIKPEGPATNSIWDIDIFNSVLRAVHGGITSDYNNPWTDGAISTYRANSWSVLDKKNGGEIYEDYVGVIIDPTDENHFFVSSFGRGVLEYNNETLLNHFTEHNSTLDNSSSRSEKYVRTIGMVFDNDNNLWVNNSGKSDIVNQLHVKNTNDEWFSFSSDLPLGDLRYEDMVITDNNDKWMTSPYFGDGILVYNDNGTFDDNSDDQDRYFSLKDNNSSGEEELVSDKVTSLAIDNSGDIWVGCKNGIVVYYNPDNIFESSANPIGSRVSIPRNDGSDQIDYLLAGETVNSIAVDGGNRKWLGTTSTGAMLVSLDGVDVIHHFTEENSPLPSNNIKEISIDQETGEVFIATTEGLVSFQSDASSGDENFNDLKVYPNPVRENFTGDITITGLVDETILKITDVSGNLINQTTSNGGTATWDGTNFYGNRVGTGVYLIFCSDKTGEKSGMVKVLFIN